MTSRSAPWWPSDCAQGQSTFRKTGGSLGRGSCAWSFVRRIDWIKSLRTAIQARSPVPECATEHTEGV